jgi:murein DD-endopeptidase MepM/ murein hydrolase activator NlpD
MCESRARWLIALGLLVPGLLVASPPLAVAKPQRPPKYVAATRAVPKQQSVARPAARNVRALASKNAVDAPVRKRALARRASVERPCPPGVSRRATARIAIRSGSRPGATIRMNRLGRASASWLPGLTGPPCPERVTPRPLLLDPSFLGDGSLLALVGPARIPTRLYLGIPSLAAESIAFAWPVLGSVASTFGQRGFGWHAGVDIRAETGTPIVAAAPGIVHASGWEGSYGWVVKIEHADGFATIYAHNLQNLVEVGDRVDAGSVIALVGRTGRASGPHLHFEIRRDGMAYNPLFLLAPRDQIAPGPDETAAVYPAVDSGDEDSVE